MKKACLTLIAFLVSFNLFFALAADLSLTKIGALDTSGKSYTEWWYTGTKPVLEGVAEASSEVVVSVDGESSTVTADGSGVWTFYSESLTEGDYEISISSGDETYAFTLHLGQGVPSDLGSTSETTSTTGSAVPETGVGQLLALVGGVSALVLGWYLYSERKTPLALG
ncbi:hypothetical protein GF360_03315 [candidate division WWE3 bacterium]|nr:hypothetical protein [candidate division WWE3 bacterium]